MLKSPPIANLHSIICDFKMTTRKKILTGIILLTITISAFAVVSLNCCDDCKTEIKKRYKYDKTSSIESYVDDCTLEFKNGIRFPLDEPVYAKIHFDKLTKPSKTLDSKQTETILRILNDTASYVWGEIGTPHFDRHFTFHDKAGYCIGYTDFSFDGQTYSTPSLAKMKWGMLTDKARETLMVTINSDKD